MNSDLNTQKRTAIAGMIEHLNYFHGPDAENEAGYSEADVDQCDDLLTSYLDRVSRMSDDDSITSEVRRIVVQLNDLNAHCGYRLIETDQREQIVPLILTAATQAGLTATVDITEQWREW